MWMEANRPVNQTIEAHVAADSSALQLHPNKHH